MCMLLFMEEEYDCTLARLKNLNIKRLLTLVVSIWKMLFI